MERLLQGMRAASEPTRLRILVLCAHGELTVSEIVQILGQSQPRVSRHLKLLVDAGLLQRNREGSWSFYRMVNEGGLEGFLEAIIDMVPEDDPIIRLDLRRLEEVKTHRSRLANEYFRRNADNWSQIRALHIDEAEVDQALKTLLLRSQPKRLLDIGTGTGHILEIAGADVEDAVGIDASREMLSVARDRLDRAALTNCQVRQADMYHLPFDTGRFDAVTVHMVMHYADRPELVIREAARVLAGNGRIVVVDFASHELETMRDEHAHRWLGFDDSDVERHFKAAGLVPEKPVHLGGGPLSVTLWAARRPANDPAVRTVPKTEVQTA